MKKVFTILMALVIIAGFAFADSSSLTLQANVSTIQPVIDIYYTGTEGSSTATQGTNRVITGITAITDGKVTAYFLLKQANTGDAFSRYGVKDGTDLDLTVTCSPFTFYGTDSEHLSADTTVVSGYPSVTATKGTSNKSNHITMKGDPTTAKQSTRTDEGTEKNEATFTVTYYGRKVTNTDAANLGTFKAEWAQQADFPAGYYQATITLAYTTN